ncbi:MAG: hypothetical protein F9K18_09540 [Thermoanaerobaculia bacterium]|nr:MAG: hypothetical protein F9K18_09540 [Thermoanaerobaculia bacterium]
MSAREPSPAVDAPARWRTFRELTAAIEAREPLAVAFALWLAKANLTARPKRAPVLLYLGHARPRDDGLERYQEAVEAVVAEVLGSVLQGKAGEPLLRRLRPRRATGRKPISGRDRWEAQELVGALQIVESVSKSKAVERAAEVLNMDTSRVWARLGEPKQHSRARTPRNRK